MVAMSALEVMCKVHITISLSMEDSEGRRGPWLTGVMWSRLEEAQEVKRLVSCQLKCSAMDYRSLDTAIFRLLYMLDGQLADFVEVTQEVKKA